MGPGNTPGPVVLSSIGVHERKVWFPVFCLQENKWHLILRQTKNNHPRRYHPKNKRLGSKQLPVGCSPSSCSALDAVVPHGQGWRGGGRPGRVVLVHQGRGSSRAGAHPSGDQRQVAGCACGPGRTDLGGGEEDGDGHGVLTGLSDSQACQKRAAPGGSQPVRQCPGVTWKRGHLGLTGQLEYSLYLLGQTSHPHLSKAGLASRELHCSSFIAEGLIFVQVIISLYERSS